MATDDDDSARRDASKRKPEELGTAPRVVMGVRLSRPGEQPKPPQEYEITPAASPEARARARVRRNTLAGMPAPAPPVTLPPPPAPRRPYQRSVSPVPWDDPPEARREAARQGDRVVAAPVSVMPPKSVSEPPAPDTGARWHHSARGTIAVIGALSVAIPATTAATTTAVVSVINALRQPTDPKLREDVEGTRKELAALRAYLADKDTARALELEKRLDAFNARLVDLDLRYPAQKVDVLRTPAK